MWSSKFPKNKKNKKLKKSKARNEKEKKNEMKRKEKGGWLFATKKSCRWYR